MPLAADLSSSRYCAIKLTNDWIVRHNDEDDACYAATLLEWNTYKNLHNPKQTNTAASKDLGQDSYKRNRDSLSENSGHHILGHGAGQASPEPVNVSST